MGRVERDREIARRRTRRAKLKTLREKYAKATSEEEKQQIRDRVHKLSPFAILEEPAAS